MSTAQIHRFKNKIALYLGQGETYLGQSETIYLTELDARRIATKLVECADDVACTEFMKSEFRTFVFDLEQGGKP